MPYYVNRQASVPQKIYQVYFLFFTGIGVYLLGAYTLSSYGFSLFASIMSFAALLWMVTSQNIISFYVFSFTTGISHHSLFAYISWIDDNIITEALCLTFLIFAGLAVIAFLSPTYSSFAFNGFLYTFFGGIFWLSVLNIFYQNNFLDLLLTYASIICFSLFVIIDIRGITSNNNHGPVYHAGQLLIDFIGIFIDFVKLLKHGRIKNRTNSN